MEHEISLQEQLAKLKAENEMLHWIIANSPGNIYWKDINGIILGCNLNNAKLVGIDSPQELVGKRNRDFFDPLLGDAIEAADKEIMLQEKEVSIEEVGIDKNMQPAIYLTKKMPMRDSHNKVIGLMGISFDITHRKKMEEDLKIAKEQAEEASQAKSEFITNMSHDVKTPLSGLISIAELLSYRLHGEDKEFAVHLLTSGQQLLNFFNNCIELFRFEKNYTVSTDEEFDLKSLLNSMRELYLPSINSKKLAFSLTVDEKVPPILRGNYNGLYRILLNLIGNAIKFTHEGGVYISVKLNEKSTPKKLHLDITVQDTGIGIAKDKQTTIFDRFTRLTPAYKGTYEGSGIGLYVVRKIVDAMHGSIVVQSDEDLGSQFLLSLPFIATDKKVLISNPPERTAKAAIKPLAPKSNKSSTQPLPNTDRLHNGIRVLLVEDNVVIQKTMQALLESISCQVTQAESGEKALMLFEPGKYDIIFMDIGLPGLQGNAVATLIRKMENGSGKRIPIIALTAHSDASPEYYESVGIDNAINKPMSIETAKEVIANYCELS